MAMKLNMLPPSVNNMSVRVFVRAAGLPVDEENMWGKTQEDEYLSKYPAGLTPTV
jgi:glutathione S-transferase